jgi:hypothetical protein
LGHEIIIMNTTFISTFGALAFASLSVSLLPSTTYAGDPRVVREHRINHLLRGAHVVLVQPTVDAAVIEQPAVETVEVQAAPVTTVVEEPATTVVEDPVVEEESDDDTVVSVLPDDSQVVVINGERCWVHDGVYYRHSDHGFKTFHPYGKHVDSKHLGGHPVANRGEKGREPHTVVNHADHINHTAHETAFHGDHKHDKRN